MATTDLAVAAYTEIVYWPTEPLIFGVELAGLINDLERAADCQHATLRSLWHIISEPLTRFPSPEGGS